MAQLIVRNVDDDLVRRLKRRAAEHGRSAEEEHRLLLEAALRSDRLIDRSREIARRRIGRRFRSSSRLAATRRAVSGYLLGSTAELWLSVLVLGELRRGVELIARRDDEAAAALRVWLDATAKDYADRILPITAAIADR